MDNNDKTREWILALAALGAGIAVKKVLESGYRKMYDEEPPNSITDRSVNWPRALAWTLVSGIAVNGVRMWIKRGGAKKLT